MSYVKAQLSVPQIEDANGNPASGYTISSYIWDTSTPTPMYTSSAGAGSATSFTLNSLGQPQSAGGTAVDIFLDTDVTYKFIIRDAGNQPVGPTIGPINASDGTASTITFLQSGTGAVERDANAKMGEIVSVLDFGSGQAAIGSAVTQLNSLGGGRLLFGGADYAITSQSGATLFHFQSCDGLVLDFTGSTFTDSTVYTSITATGYVFKFTDCKNVKFVGALRVTANAYTGATDQHGVTWCHVTGDSDGFEGEIDVVGGRRALEASDVSSTAVGSRPRNIKAQITTFNCSYPYLAGYGGDNANIKIVSDNALRDFFVFGTINNVIDVIAKNQRATSLIKSYEGKGCDNIKVTYYNRDTTTAYAAAPVIAIEFGDITAAAIRNIDIKVNTKVNASSPWNGTVALGKYDNAGAADTTGRGHVFENIKISGVSDNTGAASVNHFYRQGGALATSGTPDVARNIVVEDFTGLGTSSNVAPGPFYGAVLEGAQVWRGVVCQGSMHPGANPSTSTITLVGCQAQSLTTSTGDLGYHTYINCRITEGSLQSIINKQFIDTYYAASQQSRTALNGALSASSAQKTLTGSLTGTTSIFKVTRPTGSGATNGMFRLKYWLVADTSDLDPGTRDETYGVKTFTGAINTSGVWATFTVVADEVTERTLGTASVITVTLTNGDSTGAFIQVACTNYNGASAMGVFEIEMLSRNNAVVIPV